MTSPAAYLSDVDYRLLADNIDWELVQNASAYGYTMFELNRRLIIPTRDEETARIFAEIFKSENRKSALVFSPSVEHAEHFTAMLRLFGFRAEEMFGASPARECDKLMSHFKRGSIDVLCTVHLFNEGGCVKVRLVRLSDGSFETRDTHSPTVNQRMSVRRSRSRMAAWLGQIQIIRGDHGSKGVRAAGWAD
ncbi:hypothetical protein CVN68_11630 [Sphingomonas psychrotolerans]|uniref:Helicase C-terminal domain-containing protein n=2 Tax=Sphingomonas psychrotolerans TaxID=1327635 RepID=A0A2K8MF97_9SPHN|nr:hypothetical protein CVN68_11630 [Sphingomonas psychrotolerans]